MPSSRYFAVIDRQGHALYISIEDFFPAKAAMLRLKHLHPALARGEGATGPWTRICARCGKDIAQFRSICTICQGGH